MLNYVEERKSVSIPKSTKKGKDKTSEKTEKEKSNKERGSLASVVSQPESQVRTKTKTGFVECAITVLSIKIFSSLQINITNTSVSLAFRYALLCHPFSVTPERG